MLLFISISFLVPIVAALFGLGFGLKLYQHNQKAAKARSISMEQLAQKLGMVLIACARGRSAGFAHFEHQLLALTRAQGFELFLAEGLE